MNSTKYAVRASALSIFAACMYAAMPGAAVAQDEGPQPATVDEPAAAQPAPAAPSTPAANVDQTKIEKFADAYVAVQTIQAKATEKLQSTGNTDEAQKVQAAAETEMIQAVKKTGLEIDEFNQIVELMASDLTLRNKVSAEIEKRS